MLRFARRASPFGVAATLLAATAVSSASAASAASPFDHPQRLVDVGGRRLNLYCSGAGPVTVVFVAGSGDAGWTWRDVQPAIATRTRACVVDRAGMGFSDAPDEPATATLEGAVADLRAVLTKAGIDAPLVLVGHSYGGSLVQLYTYRYREQVKGLVLVEPGHEDEAQRLGAASQGKLNAMTDMMNGITRQCAAQADQGFVPGSAPFAMCTRGYDAGVPRTLAAARLAEMTSPAYWHTAVAENDAADAGDAALRAARAPLGDLPLVVLTRGVSPFAVPCQPPSALNQAVEAENRKLHLELAALSTRGRARVVPGAAHGIQNEQPGAVVQAVNEVLDHVGR